MCISPAVTAVRNRHGTGEHRVALNGVQQLMCLFLVLRADEDSVCLPGRQDPVTEYSGSARRGTQDRT